jgi:hypothetical protein
MTERVTSYERVYRLLFNTSTCKAAWEAALQDLKNCKIEKVGWSLSQTSDESQAKATFYFTGNFSWREDSLQHAEISAHNFMTSDLAKKVIDVHYGPEKDVKTFNCKASIVKGGGTVNRKTDYGREQEYQDSFPEWLRDRFTNEAAEEMKATTLRLKQLVAAMKATDEFRQSRQDALVEFCKNDITKALLPWHNMDQQTLQDAWDQFICTAIMRT